MEKVSKAKAVRSQQIEAIKARFKASQGGVLTDFRGLNVAQVTDLRRRFRASDVSYRVVKNTLTRIAVKGTEYEDLKAMLEGPTAIAFGGKDPMAPARVATEFAKAHEALQVKGGFLDGRVLSVAEVAEVSSMGCREDVLARLLSAINGPTQQFVGALNAVSQNFLGVLQARAAEMEKA